MKIEELKLSTRTYHALKRAGIHTVEQLQRKTDKDLYCIRNIGARSVKEIRSKVAYIPPEKIKLPTMTNADRIRAMSDRELLEFLVKHDVEQNRLRMESNGIVPTATQLSALSNTLQGVWWNWLRQPAEETPRIILDDGEKTESGLVED